MDKIAIISDIHGNMPALETVLPDIRQRGIDLIYNLGDVIGKGAYSDLAIDLCREVCHVIVQGNWEAEILRTNDHPILNWYAAQIGKERMAYLRSLPYVCDFWMSGNRVRLFHASQESVFTRIQPWMPYETHRAMFENTPFTGMDAPAPDVVGYGDIHCAYMHTLYLDHKILFNVGSVGNPLDLPLATYVIMSGSFDSQKPGFFSIDFVRIPYDIERAVEQARQVSVPETEAYAIELRTAVYRGRQKK
jgi:protein phosphatase